MKLASDILQTLPVILSDDDEGLAEASRRDAELDAEPSAGLEWKDLKKQLGRWRVRLVFHRLVQGDVCAGGPGRVRSSLRLSGVWAGYEEKGSSS